MKVEQRSLLVVLALEVLFLILELILVLMVDGFALFLFVKWTGLKVDE